MFKRFNLIPASMAAPGAERHDSAPGAFGKLRDVMSKPLQGLTIAMSGIAVIVTAGALAGGTVPPTSVFAPLKTWLTTNFLGSDWVILCGLVALVVLVWGLMHGKGWGGASIILGILAAAILGPNLIVALATATSKPAPIARELKLVSVHSMVHTAQNRLVISGKSAPQPGV